MPRQFNIALVQVSLNGTPDENLIKCLDWVRTAAGEGGAGHLSARALQLVLFLSERDDESISSSPNHCMTSRSPLSASWPQNWAW